MLRLILAPKSTEGIDEQLLKNGSENHENRKHCSSRLEMIQPKKTAILMQIKSLQGVESTQSPSCSLEAHTTPSKMKT
jgi:hypothetical protein